MLTSCQFINHQTCAQTPNIFTPESHSININMHHPIVLLVQYSSRFMSNQSTGNRVVVGSLPVSISRPRQASSASIASDDDDDLDDEGSSRARYLSDSDTDSSELNSRRPSSDGDDDGNDDGAGSRAGLQRRNDSHDGDDEGDENASESGDRVGALAPRGSASGSAGPSGQRALPSHKWPHSLTQSGFWTMATDIDLRSASHRSVHHMNV